MNLEIKLCLPTKILVAACNCFPEKYKKILYDLVIYAKVAEKAMAPHSSTLAWKIPWTEEPGRLQSMGSLRVRHD